MTRFANGEMFWLLWLNIAIIYLWYRHRRKPGAVVLPSLSLMRNASARARPTLRRSLSRGLVLLRIVAFTCFVIALARPQSIARVEQVKADVIDIFITLDISLSMGAQDFQSANRLPVVKEIIDEN